MGIFGTLWSFKEYLVDSNRIIQSYKTQPPEAVKIFHWSIPRDRAGQHILLLPRPARKKSTKAKPPIYLHSIFAILHFEISHLMNLMFSLFQTGILQATAGQKIQLKQGKNPVHQTRYFKLENCKNQVKIDSTKE